MQLFWHFNPIFIFSLIAKGPAGREEEKLDGRIFIGACL